MKRFFLILLAALLTFTGTAIAQEREVTLYGNVEDGFQKTPLPKVIVSVCRTDSTVRILTYSYHWN